MLENGSVLCNGVYCKGEVVYECACSWKRDVEGKVIGEGCGDSVRMG